MGSLAGRQQLPRLAGASPRRPGLRAWRADRSLGRPGPQPGWQGVGSQGWVPRLRASGPDRPGPSQGLWAAAEARRSGLPAARGVWLRKPSHNGPRGSGEGRVQNGGTRPSLPLWPWQGQWKAVVGQVPGRLAAGRQAATHHRGTCRGHADSAEPRRPGWLEAAPPCQTTWGPSFPWRGRPFNPCRLSNRFPHPEVTVNKDIVC